MPPNRGLSGWTRVLLGLLSPFSPTTSSTRSSTTKMEPGFMGSSIPMYGRSMSASPVVPYACRYRSMASAEGVPSTGSGRNVKIDFRGAAAAVAAAEEEGEEILVLAFLRSLLSVPLLERNHTPVSAAAPTRHTAASPALLFRYPPPPTADVPPLLRPRFLPPKPPLVVCTKIFSSKSPPPLITRLARGDWKAGEERNDVRILRNMVPLLWV
mmetsp:Transcript_18750/g.44452  ORF Transcript_18750/g.44452 Transcript_18750/m.44452 type:complete len:212 (-) Transcript_18750:270-905(-)